MLTESNETRSKQVDTIIVLIICILVAAGGNLCLKHAMSQVGYVMMMHSLSFVELGLFVLRIPTLYAGLAGYVLGMLGWLYVLSFEPLGRVYPIFVSGAFILVTLGSSVFFGEAHPPARFLGLVIIVVGIFVAS